MVSCILQVVRHARGMKLFSTTGHDARTLWLGNFLSAQEAPFFRGRINDVQVLDMSGKHV